MKYKNFAMFCLSLLFLVVFSCLLNNDSTYATSSITITLPSTPISLDVVGATLDGTFAKSDSASFTVSTTNSTGYTLNIKSDISSGNDGSGVLLYNGNDDSYTIPSLGGSGFPTGGINEATYRASSTYKNTWGYQPSMIDSSSNANFLPSPDTIGDTLNVTNCANGTVNTTCTNASDTYSIAIGAKVDSTVRVGSYSNTFVILATANAIPYTIIYDDNTITNMPVDVNTTSQADTVNISSNVPAKDGYTFLGWCDTTPTNTNGVDSCPSGHNVYNPNGNGTNLTYTLNRQSATNNLHLYAMWSKSGGGSSGNYVDVTVNFAGVGASYITGLTFSQTSGNVTQATVVSASNTEIQLLSGEEYTISGSYYGGVFQSWSSTNGLVGSTTSASTTYSTTTTDTLVLTAGRLYMYNVASSRCGETMWDNRDGVERSYTTAKIGGLCWMTTNLMIGASTTVTLTSSNTNLTTISSYTLPASGSNGVNNYGVQTCSSSQACYGYYNFTVAAAGQISGSGSYVSNSICPIGWRLPTDTEFSNLISSYNTADKLVASPFRGSYAGECGMSSTCSLYAGGNAGYYYSSRKYSSNAYYLQFFNPSFSSTAPKLDYSSGSYYRSVRCVFNI